MRINPLVVLLFNFILPVAIMFPGNRYQHIFFLLFSLTALFLSGKILRGMKFLIVYISMQALEYLIVNGDSMAGKTAIAVLVMCIQFIPCFVMASILIKDYSPSEIISALEPLKIPKTFIVALAIVVRYIPTFKREFSFMKESMRLRNIPYTIKRPIKSFEYFLVPQLFRCSILSDEITAAALIKGITTSGHRTSYYDMKMRLTDYIMCILLVTGTGATILWR